MPKIVTSFEDTGDYWKVKMNGLLQLLITKDEFLSIYSYVNGIKSKAYYIDIVYKSNTITTQYLKRDTWEEILKVLDKNII